MDELLTELRLIGENNERADGAVRRHIEAQERENKALWDEIATLRDENSQGLAALSNRLESLTRGLVADPAEVAEAMMDAQRKVAGDE